MLKIRLKRTGRKNQPHYRLVISESTRARDGKIVADVGYYNPRTEPSTFTFEKEQVETWIKNGAQPTDTVRRLLVKEGLMEAAKKGSKLAQPKKKKKEQATE